MNKTWYKDCKDDKEKEERSHNLVAAVPSLRVLKSILLDYKRDIEYNQSKADLYDSPNWAYQQADFLGQKRSLDKILELLVLED